MTHRTTAARVRLADLAQPDLTVSRDGGSVRYLEGARYGLDISVFRSRILPGSGPKPHAHPYDEVFVIHGGEGRYTVDDVVIDAVSGDIVIVPGGAWHSFTSTGSVPLEQTAIHDGPRFVETLRDGSLGGS